MTMVTILKFKPSSYAATRRRLARGMPSEEELGEVVIFPGVRLERQDFKLSDRLPDPEPGKPGLKRRRGRSSGK